MAKNPTLTLPYDYYTPVHLRQSLTEKEMRAEYSRLRSIARKRLERMGASEWADSAIYRNYQNRFKSLPDIKSPSELASLTADVATFLMKKTSSITGQEKTRKDAIQRLHASGYTFVTKENFKAFTDFMDYNRALKGGGMYDSERVLELTKIANEKGVDPEYVRKNFEFFMNNIDAFSVVPAKTQKGTQRSSAAFKAAITKLMKG